MVKFKQNRTPIFSPYDGWYDADQIFEKIMHRRFWATEDRNALAEVLEKIVVKEVKRARAYDLKLKLFEDEIAASEGVPDATSRV